MNREPNLPPHVESESATPGEKARLGRYVLCWITSATSGVIQIAIASVEGNCYWPCMKRKLIHVASGVVLIGLGWFGHAATREKASHALPVLEGYEKFVDWPPLNLDDKPVVTWDVPMTNHGPETQVELASKAASRSQNTDANAPEEYNPFVADPTDDGYMDPEFDLSKYPQFDLLKASSHKWY